MNDLKMKQDYRETFKEIHAPEALAGKVRNMAKSKERTKGLLVKKAAAAAAAIAVVFVGSNAIAYAATGNTWIGGVFRDITDWRGAVIGETYVQATDEIGVTVVEPVSDQGLVLDNGTVLLPVKIVFDNKDKIPFKHIEEISLKKYQVLDKAGKVVASADDEEVRATVEDGVTQISLPVDGQKISAGFEYTLVVESFYGHSKANAPLEIKGTWECKFVIDGSN